MNIRFLITFIDPTTGQVTVELFRGLDMTDAANYAHCDHRPCLKIEVDTTAHLNNTFDPCG